MKARVVKAWVNMVPKWRVYYDQELIATYEQKDWAQKYAEYLNTQGGNNETIHTGTND